MKTAIRVLAVVLLAGLAASCPFLDREYYDLPPEVEDPQLPDDGFGALEILFSAGSSGAKTLVPTTEELDIVRYVIEGTLEGGGDSFSTSVDAGESLTKSGLSQGWWSISVDAINSDEVEVGHGDATADIVAGESTTVQIMILPSVGSGDLNITIQWKKQLFTSEEIVASVIPDLGGSSSLPFSPIDEDGAYHFSTCSLYGVDAGYYLVILQLIGDGQQVWGIAEAVVIFAGAATSHTYTYTQK